MRATTFVFTLLLLTLAQSAFAVEYGFYGQPLPFYYFQPQSVLVFGQTQPVSPYASRVVYFGMAAMPDYTYPVGAVGGYGAVPLGSPYFAGYPYWPQPIFYGAPL